MFSTVPHVYFFVGGGQFHSRTEWRPLPDLLLPGSATVTLSITKTESKMQKLIQVVEDNRKRLADSHKNTLGAYDLASH